jgi:hypothetical protein
VPQDSCTPHVLLHLHTPPRCQQHYRHASQAQLHFVRPLCSEQLTMVMYMSMASVSSSVSLTYCCPN